ncbi:biotin--protein ligase isoform X2 [Amblyraja radiata]|uniref:biotin--protein ligase isoform X2 n=1 Tax=Amblyraja radiata TaxID=386614 RepID=UPI00140260C0|nr:biotin--protein ligase isoform X2 [Amblyraja radiata]XP_032888337.1 biotin--protein ligase isoform X2 [Amblyraja radiata]
MLPHPLSFSSIFVYLSRTVDDGSMKLSDDLSKWSLYEPKIANPEYTQHGKHIVFLIEAALENVCFDSISVPSEKIIKYSDLCTPLAYLLGDPYKLIAETNVDDFSRLGVAFMENRLQMDDGMVPRKIISLQINESVQMKLLQSNAVFEKASKKPGDPQIQDIVDETSAKDTSSKLTNEATVGSFGDCYCAASSGKAQQLDMAEITEVHSKEFHTSQEGMELQSHHLHLASCSECLEMENSTIESVRYASAENLLDLSDDYCGSSDETVIGEDNLMENTRQNNKSGKPPNVLIYVGSNYSQYLTKFQQVKSILIDCLDNDRYAIYPLLEEQILKEPWADNSLLLVVACDKPVSEQMNGQFMSYLSKGGKILGLCTPFCFGEIKISHKNELKEKIHRFSFTKSDGTDVILDAFTSGNIFLKEVNSTENATKDLELLGSLTDLEKDMVIVRLSYGEKGGEAVLCQVHLEIPPDSTEIQVQEDFTALKQSNALRYEVLTEILKHLQLSCGLSEIPPLTPVHLLAKAEETQRTFLRWLRPQLDEEGVLKLPKISLKVVTKHQPGLEATPSSLPLIVDSHKFSSEYFDVKIYCENLQTQLLGQLIFFSEVIPTTMDVFDGLMLQLPEEVGLIAIAVRQTQGKGRGQNIWISPIGSAMFTIQVRIQLNSQLGQNISFLQHLVALAAVESVLSIPGYEDIDLKVKWPNDIYFSNLMKLGGVLVNSTLMGTTFHMLVGCGFNVTNSNPTICINDIIQQHNKVHGTHLQLLRTDQLMARTVTVLENLISTFQTEGANGVLPLYYKRWVHSGTQVRLWKEDGPAAWIIGLDDSGFLQVFQEGDNNIVTVQPDGNSFDMLRNLIITKQH